MHAACRRYLGYMRGAEAAAISGALRGQGLWKMAGSSGCGETSPGRQSGDRKLPPLGCRWWHCCCLGKLSLTSQCWMGSREEPWHTNTVNCAITRARCLHFQLLWGFGSFCPCSPSPCCSACPASARWSALPICSLSYPPLVATHLSLSIKQLSDIIFPGLVLYLCWEICSKDSLHDSFAVEGDNGRYSMCEFREYILK